jgi:pyruvate/2-oxoglutarate dehydrogenase complex dihydrolipoamide dehydrogenase (E3) component
LDVARRDRRPRILRDGVDVRMKTKPKGVTWNDGSHTLTLDDGTTITAERLCVATGRKPRTADLGLESAGVTLDDDGAITIDETCRAAGGIYAIGDVTNIAPLTHVAKYQARIAAATILGSHAKARYDAVPRCVYTAPEFAAVGITRKGAAERGIELLAAQVTFDEITRPALYSDPPADGALELFADAKHASSSAAGRSTQLRAK